MTVVIRYKKPLSEKDSFKVVKPEDEYSWTNRVAAIKRLGWLLISVSFE